MSSLRKPRFTSEQYLEMERSAPYKSEYLHGEIFAMAGASRAHNRISTNVAAALTVLLRGEPCEAFSNDMRVQVNESGMYTYPDIVVVCGEPQFRDEAEDTLLNPTVIVEVLSRSTEAYDRGEKFAWYSRLDSLCDYLLIAQDRYRAEQFVRQPDHQWLATEATAPDAVLHLSSLGCDLLLSEVYDKVVFRRE